MFIRGVIRRSGNNKEKEEIKEDKEYQSHSTMNQENNEKYTSMNTFNQDILSPVDCKYYNEQSFNSITHLNPKFTIFHMNVRSLNSNKLDLLAFLETLNVKFDIIALSEIGKTFIRENATYFRNYKFYWQESTTRAGGTGLFVKEGIDVLHEFIEFVY